MEIAEEIRAGILAATSLTASAGVSFNKFLAKLASDQNKPNGLTVIRPHQAPGFVESLPVGRFHGVGPVTKAKMEQLGIVTGADLKARDMEFLRRHFGSSAERFHAIARGIDDRPVQPNRERKSVGAETTFLEDLVDLAPAREAIGPLAEKVALRCAEKGVLGHCVTLKVKYADFEQITRQRTLRGLVGQVDEIAAVALGILSELHPFKRPVRLLGLSLSALEEKAEAGSGQLDLFTTSE